MKKTGLILMLLVSGLGMSQSSPSPKTINTENLIGNLTSEDLGTFKWMNEPKSFTIKNGTVTVVAPKGSDFFNNPEDGQITGTAPFLYTEIEGDFVAKAHVKPDFSSQWNAIGLMVYADRNHWIKFAFENSDATGPSIVTVVTKTLSDDANGVVLGDTAAIWLKLIRKGNNYSMLWSKDDFDYKMARLTTLPNASVVKIGLEAQCPVGTIVHPPMFRTAFIGEKNGGNYEKGNLINVL